MPRWVPFTADIRIVPDRGSGLIKTKRFETWRDMQKIGALIFEGLEVSTILNIAEPGGGQHGSGGGQGRSGLSGMTRGTGVKPQMGEVPAQASISGFYDANDLNVQPHPEKQLIHAGEVVTGPGSAPWLNNPATATDSGVSGLKNELETRIAANLPSGVTFEIWRIDYSGVVYGDKGYHFPV